MLSMLKLCSTFECYTAMEHPTNRLSFTGVHTSLYHSIENTAANREDIVDVTYCR